MLDHPAAAPQAPPIARRDRSLPRGPAGADDQAVLNGTAVLAILRRRKLALQVGTQIRGKEKAQSGRIREGKTATEAIEISGR